MSVKFSGNTINKFGKMLPTLYFEKIYLYDTHIRVKLAMYVDAVEDQEDAFAAYATDYLNDLNYYVMFVLDGETSPYWASSTNPAIAEYYPIDEIGVEGTRRLEKLLSGEKTILDLVRYAGEPSMCALAAAKEEFDRDSPYNAADVFTIDGIDKIDGEWDGEPIYSGGDSSDPDECCALDGGLDIPTEVTSTTTLMGTPLLYPSFGTCRQNFYKFVFDDFTSIPETIYNANGNPIYKYVVGLDLATAGASMQQFILQFHRIPKLSMVAFTAHHDLDITSTNYDFLAAARSNKGIGKLYDAKVSDATYEKVTNFGVVDSDPISIYVLPNQSEYDETPIQAIDSVYYAPVDVTLEEIRSKFKAFVGTGLSSDSQIQDIYDSLNYILEKYGDSPELLPRLDVFRKTFPDTSTATAPGKIYQSFKVMLYNADNAVKRGTVLMKKLIKSAVVMDYRSTEPLTWQPPADEDIEIGAPELEHNFINTDLMQINKYGLHIGRYAHATGQNKQNIYINGYWFFDYERALRKTSNIARIFHNGVKKIDAYFGRGVLNSCFNLMHTLHARKRILDNINTYFLGWGGKLTRHESDCPSPDAGTPSVGPDPSNPWGNNTNFSEVTEIPPTVAVNQCLTIYDTDAFDFSAEAFSGETDADVNLYPTVKYYRNYTNSEYKNEYGGGTWGSIQYTEDRNISALPHFLRENIDGVEDDVEIFGVTAGTTHTTHDFIRNFDFFDKLTIDGEPYRLMAFEFQELSKNQRTDYDYEPTFNDYLMFSVVVEDKTKDVYDLLISQYMSMRDTFIEYYDAAYEFCSYNNVDGNFNTFFQTAMEQQNSEEPEQAPWIMAPVIYYFHVDLLTDAFGGSFDKIIDAAIRESEGINPTTGRLEDVKTFREKIEELYNINYEPSNPEGLPAHAEGLRNSRTIFGGAGKTYFPLPELKTDMPVGAQISTMPTELVVGDVDPDDIFGEDDQGGAVTPFTRGGLKMVKMAFGFKQIPKHSTDHDSDGYIRITPVGGLQELPNGENATASTAATLEQICSPYGRDKADATGIYLYNSNWDYDGNKCRPSTEKYRTVWLYPGITYTIMWYARATEGGTAYGGDLAPLIYTTATITVPTGEPGTGGADIEGSEENSGQKIDDQAQLTDSRYNYYVLRAGCKRTNAFEGASRRGLFGKTKSSFYDADQSLWENIEAEPDWRTFAGYKFTAPYGT